VNSYDVVCYVCGGTLFSTPSPLLGVEPRTLCWCEHCTSNRVLALCLLRSNPFGAGCTNDVGVVSC
jgi:hypothetical protein